MFAGDNDGGEFSLGDSCRLEGCTIPLMLLLDAMRVVEAGETRIQIWPECGGVAVDMEFGFEPLESSEGGVVESSFWGLVFGRRFAFKNCCCCC